MLYMEKILIPPPLQGRGSMKTFPLLSLIIVLLSVISGVKRNHGERTISRGPPPSVRGYTGAVRNPRCGNPLARDEDRRASVPCEVGLFLD